ncbi:cupin domain-containing protein [Streptomyces sp. BPTC-684]|uniref:cupin domain-containing protein n=1 Tax=Streptomyces sp. BPTC-684 TaxID=3043734 RepID=UPI0024B1FE53|nr:cupin domain-containing protein [Streptomyces sp. BPTC-684]WHM40566.1 cupin domain-containing protein [Streptomyces sp. BPTC-684]
MTHIVLPGQRPEGRRGFEIVLSSKMTGQAASWVETRQGPAWSGPPLHTHAESTETYYVVSGTLLVQVDDEVVELRPRALAHITSGTRHTWATPPGEGAHFLTLHMPGGYEDYHPTALQAEKDNGGPLTQEDLFKIAARFDWRPAGDTPMRLTPDGRLVPASQADDEASRLRAEWLAAQGEKAEITPIHDPGFYVTNQPA